MSVRISRTIDPAHLKRASKVDPSNLGPYMESTVTAMQIALDQWRYHGDDGADLQLALSAFLALVTEAERRGLL